MLTKSNYVERFLKMRCAGDVLNAVGPISNCLKEITESMAIINKIRPLILNNPMKYSLIDLCAGNCLTSIIAAHLFPLKHVVALDIRKKNQDRFKPVTRFFYVEKNIYDKDVINMIFEHTIIISVHPCKILAKRVIELYNKSKSPMFVMMPCCSGHISTIKNEDKYTAWCKHLYSLLDYSEITLGKDDNCVSEKNVIITAIKKILINDV